MTTLILLLTLTADPWATPSAAWQPLPAVNPWAVLPVVESAPTEPKWTRLKSPSTFPADPYADVHSLPCGYFYPDTHEQLHYVHAWLDNSWGLEAKRKRAIYCLQGRIAIIDEPPVTLRQVAETVPVAQRLGLYRTYLVQQQSDRNHRPTSILAEWACYSAQYAADGQTPEYVTQWVPYASTLLTLAERCPTYDAGPLRTFIRWHTARVNAQIRSQKVAPAFGAIRARAAGQCTAGNCR